MGLIQQFAFLALGLALLWKTGGMAVRYAVGLSLVYKIEKFTIGFFIFAISTGLPEITTVFIASFQKVPELSAGDLMGSTLVNLTLVLGVAAVIGKKIEVDRAIRKNLYPTIALIAIIFVGIAFVTNGTIFTGILLITLYFVSAFWSRAGMTKEAVTEEFEQVEHEMEKKPLLSPKVDILLKLFGSLIFLILSSWVTVYAATSIATTLNLHLFMVGATLIAVGTSFPELALEIQAVRKKEYSLALGDIFGSSLLNVSLILGILTLINPDVDLAFGRQILPFLGASLLWMVRRLLQKKPLHRRDGIFFLVIFALYLAWAVLSELLTNI
ncbi:MAG: Inner membrane protein YrbG [Chlamydiae bacterium]|nr:Inner membrane protein YrbG [Chlamydiota bacterium]